MQHGISFLVTRRYLCILSVPISCSENTKNVLLSCAFIHLEKKEFIKQFAEISSINQRILLSGPAGAYFVSIWRPVLCCLPFPIDLN